MNATRLYSFPLRNRNRGDDYEFYYTVVRSIVFQTARLGISMNSVIPGHADGNIHIPEPTMRYVSRNCSFLVTFLDQKSVSALLGSDKGVSHSRVQGGDGSCNIRG